MLHYPAVFSCGFPCSESRAKLITLSFLSFQYLQAPKALWKDYIFWVQSQLKCSECLFFFFPFSSHKILTPVLIHFLWGPLELHQNPPLEGRNEILKFRLYRLICLLLFHRISLPGIWWGFRISLGCCFYLMWNGWSRMKSSPPCFFSSHWFCYGLLPVQDTILQDFCLFVCFYMKYLLLAFNVDVLSLNSRVLFSLLKLWEGRRY